MKYINALTVTAPVHIGDVLLKDIAGTGVDLIATKEVLSQNRRCSCKSKKCR